MKQTSRLILLFSAVTLLSACGIGDGIIGTGADDKVTISGSAQKGPFELGSTVSVNRLTTTGEATENTLTTETSDDLGNFSFSLNNSGPIQVSVEGYHFNEISGKRSDSTLTLRAIYQPSSIAEQTAHVNILTHLIHNRVLFLLEQGDATRDAIQAAQTEWINTFQKVLIVDDLSDFTNLNLFDLDDAFSDGNAYLLALSAIVYQYADSKAALKENSVDAELTAVLNYLANDFADDGEISDEVVLGDLATASRLVRPNNIEENLANRSYQVTNHRLQVAQMNRFIDSDGDGLVNTDDDDDDNDGYLDIDDVTPYGIRPDRVNGNYKPLAASSVSSTDEDTMLEIDLLVNDLDGDILTVFIEDYPRRGILRGKYPNITYTPYPNAFGTDKFTYKVSDGISDSQVATVEITINPVNDLPVIHNRPPTDIMANMPFKWSPEITDIDSSKFVFRADNLPTWLTINDNTGEITGNPTNGEARTYETIGIYVNDGTDEFNLVNLSLNVQYNPWSTIISDWPRQNWGETTSYFQDEIFVIGGRGGSYNNTFLKSVDIYNLLNKTWHEGKSLDNYGRANHSSVMLNEKIFVIGGYIWAGKKTSLTQSYDPTTDSWATHAPMNIARSAHMSCSSNGKIYVFGGAGEDFLYNLPEVEEYDPTTDSWIIKTTLPHPFIWGNSSASCTTLGNKIYIFGSQKNGIRIYDTVEDQWDSGIPSPWGTLESVRTSVYMNRLVVTGGTITQFYDPTLNQWTIGPNMLTGRRYHFSFVNDNSLYVVGGRDNDSGINTMDVLDLTYKFDN